MTDTLTKIVVNCQTGEQSIVPLTAEEITQRENENAIFMAEKEAAEQEKAAKAAAKASGIAKLLALGLTQEEAEALINK